jgi:hypothetical protein
MGASIAAARLGLKVALIQDRPVVGGNASSEIRVPPVGYIGSPPDKINVTGITEELFGEQGGAADQSRMDRVVQAEKNLRLFLNTRATSVDSHSISHALLEEHPQPFHGRAMSLGDAARVCRDAGDAPNVRHGSGWGHGGGNRHEAQDQSPWRL